MDGAHRLSAVAAWVNDDYGDGFISEKFYNGEISEEQKDVARRTCNLVASRVGHYRDYLNIIKHPEKSASEAQ